MGERVYVAYVGGTIGMRSTRAGYAPEPGHMSALFEQLISDAGTALPHVTFEEHLPLLDSSNATLETWSQLARTVFERLHDYDGFVILHGTGNGPANDESFLKAIADATDSGVVVVVVTQCLRGRVIPTAYATGSALLCAGAIPGHDMTTEAALAKLEVLLGEGLPADEVREMMLTDLAGELS
ncbi:MAG: asparaginase domain-containing protein [Actinomycetota bacterium]|jgi:L-asparaginase/Glu-tRNA(Gln) amidotransferase subunit D|nr:asparaginase domain-containing protein [Actinomycetota bacterium]